MADEWLKEIPTEPGHYWFHGTTAFGRGKTKRAPGECWPHLWVPDPELPKTRMVRVNLAGGDRPFLIYVSNGAFVYPDQEGYEGLWQKFDLPVPPKNLLEGLDKMGAKG